MTKRALTAILAVGLTVGAAACGNTIDKEGTKENLVESGIPEEQADCMVDRIDDEFGDDDDVIDELTKDEPDLNPEDQARIQEIIGECLGGTATTAGG